MEHNLRHEKPFVPKITYLTAGGGQEFREMVQFLQALSLSGAFFGKIVADRIWATSGRHGNALAGTFTVTWLIIRWERRGLYGGRGQVNDTSFAT